MRRALIAMAFVGCSNSSSSGPPKAPEVPEVKVWGALREMIHDGRVEARVEIASVATPGTYGLGALAGMRGEVTIVDGTPWVARGDTNAGRATGGATTESAALLVAAVVPRWQEIAIDADIAAGDLDARIEKYAAAVGVGVDKPFAFVIEGAVDARWHVLQGPPEPGANAHDHTRNAVVGEHHGKAIVVGVFSKHHHGVFTHMGQNVHAHIVDASSALSAHADELSIRAGSVLRLPR